MIGKPTKVTTLPRLTYSFGSKNTIKTPIIAILDNGLKTNSVLYNLTARIRFPITPTKAKSGAYHKTEIEYYSKSIDLLRISRYSIPVYFFVIPPKDFSKNLLLRIPFVNDTKLYFEHNNSINILKVNMVFNDTRLIVTVFNDKLIRPQ